MIQEPSTILEKDSIDSVEARAVKLGGRSVALIDWSHLIEDYLSNIGLTIEDFCRQSTGGWMFGYIEALQKQRIQTTLYCFSAQVIYTKQYIHQPTGAKILILPASKLYLTARKRIQNPYAASFEQSTRQVFILKKPFYLLLYHLVPYLATPVWTLYKALKKENIGAILCQEYENPRFDICILLGKLLKKPVYASFQGGNWQLSKLEKYVRPLMLRHCAGLIVGAGDEVERLKNIYHLPDAKIARIYNPVDLHTWTGITKEEARTLLGIAPQTKVVAWHGRINYHRKGLDVLLSAWQQIALNRPNEQILLLLIGNGGDAHLLRQQLAEMNVPQVRWIDEYINDRQQIVQFLKASDIYVFPSRNEGFPVAPLEAMACGLPLLATDAPGLKDILEDGEKSGGILVSRDDTSAFTQALNQLLDDPSRCRALGYQAEQWVNSHYSLSAVGKQLHQFLFNTPAHD